MNDLELLELRALTPRELAEVGGGFSGHVAAGLAVAAFWGKCASVGYRLGREAADAIWGG